MIENTEVEAVCWVWGTSSLYMRKRSVESGFDSLFVLRQRLIQFQEQEKMLLEWSFQKFKLSTEGRGKDSRTGNFWSDNSYVTVASRTHTQSEGAAAERRERSRAGAELWRSQRSSRIRLFAAPVNSPENGSPLFPVTRATSFLLHSPSLPPAP